MHHKTNASGTTRIVDMIEKVRFFGLDDLNASDVPNEWIANTVSAADRLLDHRFRCFAVDNIYLGKEVIWNRELKRDIRTPLGFGPWMDYRNTDLYGHFKYFWELGRFQHLITLAKAYYLTGDEKYAFEVADQMKSFVKQCPYLLGVHWIMPMEVGLRLISVVWIIALMRKYLKHHVETCNTIEEIVTSHVEYTANNFSAYSSANNHLIGEAAGVFVAGVCFEGLAGMNRPRHQSKEILCREIDRQFHRDGVNREQTTHYHVACYNCFLLAGLVGRQNGIEFGQEYWQTLEKAAEFICALSNNDNSIFHIGDSDDGKTIVLSETDCNQVQSLLATAAVLFHSSDFKAKAGYFDEMSLWLLGKKGRDDFEALVEDSKAPCRKQFEHGGYYILSSDGPAQPKAVFDCGPLGFGAIAAHGHADSLSLLLYAYGRQFLIDPGTYTFETENPYRDYFRSTPAHNTITVDGADQSEMRGPFLWGRKAESFVEEWVDTDKYTRVTGWHDGYQRLADPVIHRRTVELDKQHNVIDISDSIEAKAEHEICQHFHFFPECELAEVANNHWRISNKGKTIDLSVDARFQCIIVKGSESPICGWASTSCGRKVPINTLVARSLSHGSQSFLTRISL